MSRIQEIRDALRDHASKYGPPPTMIGVVSEVSSDGDTCTLIDEETDFEYPGIRLRPVIDGNEALTIIPKIGTFALAVRLENEEEWMIISVGQADKYIMVVGNIRFEMSGGQILLQNGAESLKTLFDDLLTAILAMEFTTNTGVTISLVNSVTFVNLKTRFESLFK
jgi:hypothetical protein